MKIMKDEPIKKHMSATDLLVSKQPTQSTSENLGVAKMLSWERKFHSQELALK